MIRSSLFTRSALGLALALGLTAGGLAVSAPAEAQSKKKEKAPENKAAANSKEFVTAAGPLLKTLQDSQPIFAKYAAAQGAAKEVALLELKAVFVPAPAQLQTAEIAIKTPGDRYLAGQWGLQVGSVLADSVLQQRGAQLAIDSGVAPPDQLDSLNSRLGVAAYFNKDYATAAKVFASVPAANHSDLTNVEMMVDAYARTGQPTLGLNALKAVIDARKSAGQTSPNDWYERGVRVAFGAKLNAESMEWALMRLEAYPNQFNWISAAQIIRAGDSYSSNEAIDISRAVDRAGALRKNDSQSVTQEYVDYIQAASGRAGVLYPGEVNRVVNQGLAIGALQKSDPFVNDALTESARRLPKDMADLPALERDGRAGSATAKMTLIAADTLLSYGKNESAAQLYGIALSKPGVDIETAQLRLGIAQLAMGNSTDALASFAKVDGKRKMIAKLWMLLAQNKAVAAN